ncbi:MAG: hypothetical protein KGY76_01905 [Candidatus Thermoplasmatota archaeon]|nr:hypothetical protein [Candidatus Thermoplasmatota archaeon]
MILAPSPMFQYYQFIFGSVLGLILIGIGLYQRRDEDDLNPLVSLVSAFSLVAATIILSNAQYHIKYIHWYEIQFPGHYKTNYYSLVTLLFISLIGGFILTCYILYNDLSDSKKKKMTSVLAVIILSIAIIASISSSAIVPEKQTTYRYDLSLENISEETSYVLYVPTIYNTREQKMDAVFKDKDVQGEANINHINSDNGIVLKINGTGPLGVDFHYQGSEEDYDLLMNDDLKNKSEESSYESEKFLLYYNSTSDQQAKIDLQYERSIPTRHKEFQVNGELNETGWQSVRGFYGESVAC